VKLDMAEVRAQEHYAAYVEATKRTDARYLALAEQLRRQQQEAERARPEKQAKRRA
jgi:hypothetical protein